MLFTATIRNGSTSRRIAAEVSTAQPSDDITEFMRMGPIVDQFVDDHFQGFELIGCYYYPESQRNEWESMREFIAAQNSRFEQFKIWLAMQATKL